jgi:hypothetical protein
MKEALRTGAVEGSNVDYEKVKKETLRMCPDCVKGNMEHLPRSYSSTDYSTAGKFEFVVTDEKGPLKAESFEGHYRYFDLFSFKSSGWLSVLFKRKKDEFYNNFEQVISDVKIYDASGKGIRFIQTDDAQLYKSNEMERILREERIQQRLTAPYEHSSNGWIEREMRTVIEKARKIMNIYNCPSTVLELCD